MEEIKYILRPEPVPFNISTIDMKVQYQTAQATVRLEVLRDAIAHVQPKYCMTELVFETVAEVCCISMNFFESNYTNSEVIDIKGGLSKEVFWQTHGYCADSGLYQVINSSLLEQKRKVYDPSNSLSLEHYLIVGYDCYVEIVARRYTYTIADIPNVYVAE